jgi:pilus assembly protein CpaC
MFVDLSVQRGRVCLLLVILFCADHPAISWGQLGASDPVQFRVEGPSQRLEMIANTSRILTLDKEIPRALVNNTEIVRVVPLSPNQVQVSALQPGVTQINLWDETGDVHSVDVVVFGDARQLEMLIRSEFPHAALRVRPLASSVVLSGYVDRPEVVSRIIRLAEDYYPKVINNITVGGVQQVALHVKVMEVSRTKLRQLGFDWALFLDGGDFAYQRVNGLIGFEDELGLGGLAAVGESVAFGVVDQSSEFFGFIDALRQNNLVKVLAEPTLVTVSGRPASFNSGGEFPILVPQRLGTISIEWREFGTRVDFVPIVLGNGNIRLEVRPQISELDYSRGVRLADTIVPGLRSRWADTAAEMRAGQTLAVAGLMQTKVESVSTGLPWLGDLPWVGAAFRRVEEERNEVELLILVRPQLVDALEPCEVPCVGPGESTVPPNDIELYLRGYLEVPNCCPPDCGQGYSHGPGLPGGPMMIPPSPTLPADGSTHPGGPDSDFESVAPPTGSPDGASLGRPLGPAASPSGWPSQPSARRPTVRPSTYQAQPVTPRQPAERNDGFHSSNRFMPSQPTTPDGLFGPTGYDKLD